MKAALEPITQEVNVGTCPVCRAYLWAEVDVVREISEPKWEKPVNAYAAATATAYVSCRLDAMRLNHECKKDDDR